MFERFTEEARQVIVAAQADARLLGHDHIGTEHILIGLLRNPEALPGRALAEFGVGADAALARVSELVAGGGEPTAGPIPFTAASKKALELALRAALALGHNWIESGHLLLGLLDVGPSPGYETLASLGVDLDSLRGRVVVHLSESDRPPERGRRAAGRSSVEMREVSGQVSGEVSGFTVVPDSRLQHLLMAAAGRALQQARTEFRIEDVLEALKDSQPGEDPPPTAEG
jgi:ATP-dependent Clp protease ATP-binding subunit ClpC